MYNFCWFCEESKTRKKFNKKHKFLLGGKIGGGGSRAQGGERERTRDVGVAGSEGDPTAFLLASAEGNGLVSPL